jgi:type VI secretion system secreted protein Hcp
VIGAYLRLKGEKAGDVKGPVIDRNEKKNGTIALLGIEHGVASVRDSATGLAAGKRQHHPIIVTKETDRTSPILYRMLTTNELITDFTLLFYGVEESMGLLGGRETLLYTIALKKAFVSRIDLSGSVDKQAEAADRLPLTERVSFVYETIVWEWASGGIIAEDGWSTGNL